MNPFEDIANVGGHLSTKCYYTELVFNQVFNMRDGESKSVDLHGKSVSDFRMTLRYVSDSKMRGAKFKTKVAKDGALWVLRVS